MTRTILAKNWVRRTIIAASAVCVAAGTGLAISGCSTQAMGQSTATRTTANCNGPAAITSGSCTTPEGSWKYTVTIPASGGAPATVFQGVETYDSGGGYTEADELSVLPGYSATAGHDAWSATTATSGFLLTYQNLTYDPTNSGNPTGYSRVRQTTTIDSTGTNYTGSGDFTYYDTTGAAIAGASGTFTITATKILVSQPGS